MKPPPTRALPEHVAARRPIEKLVLRGRARQRGQAHGEQLRALVHEHLERWEAALAADLGLGADAYADRFFAETDFFPAIERWTPDLLEEVRGIAEGAGTDFRRTLLRQLSDEEPWFRREIRLQAGGGKGCSSLGVAPGPGRPTVIAQNMDVGAWWDGHQVLLHIIDPDSPVEALVFTVAGKISLCGLNSKGVGMCCNTLSQLDYCRDGLPEDFVVRGFLQRPDLDAGLDFLRAVRHASGQNYTVGGPGRMPANVECSARQVVASVAEGARLMHTNHPLANGDQSIYRSLSAGLDEAARRRLYYGSSHPRWDALQRHFVDDPAAGSLDSIRQALSLHEGAVCRHGQLDGAFDQFTLGCLIMELDARPVLHLAPGPPCCTPFQVFGFGAG